MEFRQIRYLLEIVRCSGFTRAAESLNISQPSLSTAVQKLEEELGATLLNRQERKITLTAEGRAFFERARQMEDLMKDMVHEMEEFRGLERGELRIGIPVMLGAHFFPPVIARFRQHYPKLKLSICSHGANMIQAMIKSGTLDAGIVAKAEFSDGIVWQPLMREEMVACVADSHPLARQRSVTLAEVAREPLILFNEEYFQRQYLTEALARLGLKPTVVFETNLVPLLKKVIAGGGGVSTLLRMAVDEPGLAAVPFDPPLIVEAGVVWKKNAYLSKATRAFIEFLADVSG